jgi:uncharacterized protein YajQ (UPF0234 family)
MANFSFDIVSEINMQEADNAINQAQKELATRYDFKGSKSSIDFNRDKKEITLIADDDFKLRSLADILNGKMIKRGISSKFLNYKTAEKAFEGTLKQIVEISNGIDREKAKDLVKIIKDTKLKVQTQIEGEKLRIIGAKKDDLQAVMAHLKTINFPLPLTFCNYR